MFIFLLSGINFLLLFLLTTVKITCDVEVGVALDRLERAEMGSLVDDS